MIALIEGRNCKRCSPNRATQSGFEGTTISLRPKHRAGDDEDD